MDEKWQTRSLCTEQRRGWESGKPIPVEAYLRERPDLIEDREAVLDLIYNEIFLRTTRGDLPLLEEYQRRFPELGEDLRLLFEVHQALEDESADRPTADLRGNKIPVIHALHRSSGSVQLPGYEILDELGRGGMGVVYKARDVELKRLVALKMIRTGAHASLAELTRFRSEGEALARLRHPNIVQIYAVEVHDNCPFFCLELVEGESLKKRLEAGPLPLEEAAELTEALARAAEHAHAQGIIHRDLKPGNILLAVGREVATIPKIADFGLAKFLDGEDSATVTGAFIGTPNYTSPEQAVGRSVLIGPATDVYGLGAVLYEMLTGRPPFEGATPLDTLEMVRSEEPSPPSRWRKGLPRDLEAICLKCLAKLPGERYRSALDLAEDLHRFRSGEPVQARPVPSWRRWVRRLRKPAFRVALMVVLPALLGLVALEVWHHQRDQQTRDVARQAESDRRQRARSRYESFVQHRDEAMSNGAFGVFLMDSDADRHRRATRLAARAALAEVQTGPDSDALPVLESYWTEAERADVAIGCYQLMLLLAEVESTDTSLPESGTRARAALAILDRSSRLGSPTPAFHLRRARYLRQLGDANAAGKQEGLAATLPPTSMIDHFLLGQESGRQGNVAAARAHFEAALREQPRDFWSRFSLGLCQLQSGQAAEARAALSLCIEQKPRFVPTYLLRANACEQLRVFDAAEADYRRALELEPRDDERFSLLVNRGRMWLLRERFAEAVADLRQARDINPEHFAAYLNLARLSCKQGQTAEAARWLNLARKHSLPAAALADYREEEARQLFIEKRYDDALTACDEALKSRPDLADVHALRGRTLLHLQRFAPAADAFDRSLTLGSQSPAEIYRGRGQARMKLRDYPGAVDDYTHALDLAKEPDADLCLHRGWAYFFADSWRLALRDFDTVLRLTPRNADAYSGRGLSRVMLGQYRAAVADAEESVRNNPLTPEMMHNNACIFAQAVGRLENDVAATDRAELTDRYRGRSVELLRRGLKLVPEKDRSAFWRERVRPDTALDPIRGSAEFKTLDTETTEPK